MAFSSSVQVLRDGYRNYVIRLAGGCLVGETADQPATVLVNIATLNPPCGAIRVDRVRYSLPHGHPLDVQLYWQATTNQLFWAVAGGDSEDFERFGGLTNNAAPGATGNIMWATSGATDAGGHTAGTTLSFAIILECTKLQVKYPL